MAEGMAAELRAVGLAEEVEVVEGRWWRWRWRGRWW